MDVSRASALADERFAAFRTETDTPAIAYGLVKDGVLVHSGGVGALADGRVPGPDDVFRIASMTKSFTAAAVLMLRDRGLLRLDDELATHLPWTVGLRPDTGGLAITVRDLLRMNAGFPTDDPWGDRYESLPLGDFDALVADGISFARPPRTGYEYSNLGYALLGRVVTAVSGADYLDLVRAEILGPLGLTSTSYDAHVVPPDRLVAGFAPREGGLVAEALTGPGAFSPMGGLHSTVRDLGVWVAGFQSSWDGDSTIPSPGGAAARCRSRRPTSVPRPWPRRTVSPAASCPRRTASGWRSTTTRCSAASCRTRAATPASGRTSLEPGDRVAW